MELFLRAAPDAGPGDVEIVERKGIGHPDTICDAVAESVSAALGRAYLERCGSILHHNVDKALLRGGASRPAWGGGEVTAPMELFLAGRATNRIGDVDVPVEEISVETARAWLREHMHALDAERHVRLHSLLRPGSADLVELFRDQGRAGGFLANDTSCGAGYAPLSELEQIVLAVSRHAEGLARSGAAPEVGEDVKVMGVRRGGRIDLTVACAFVGRFLGDHDRYLERRAALAAGASEVARERTVREVAVTVNGADDDARRRAYLTVTGTSAEAGDDGQVGRGNRVNGLIAPYRPMTLEAAAGKNPVSHVGKLYNLAAHSIAADLVRELPEVAEAQVWLVSRIGRRADDPAVADVRLRTRDGVTAAALAARVRPIVHAGVAGVSRLWERLVRGELSLY